jgi:hypothetical protein
MPLSLLAASMDLGTAVVVLIAVLALGWLVARAARSGDADRIRDDLARRGARLVDCTRKRDVPGGEREYEVIYALADGVERRAICKTSLVQGEWWQGDTPPPPLPREREAPAASPEAPAPEPAEAGRTVAAADEPAEEVADIDPAVALEGQWRAEEDPDREVEGEEPEEALRPVDELIEVLRGGESRACERAVEELVKHGPAAVAALRAALQDPDADVRVDAKKALQRIEEA